MKTLIVGDIHGCYAEFMDLLDKASLSETDQIIAVGDIVDRGPDSPNVLDFFKNHRHTQTVMGNHERKHVGGAEGKVKLAASQIMAREQFGSTYSNALAFMSALPLYIELPEAFICHGFYEPGLPINEQRDVVLVGTMTGGNHLTQQYSQPWYELYDGERPLVVGHQNYNRSDQPFVYRDRVYGLDTSVYQGLALTGLLLPAFEFISVPARDNHWNRAKLAYSQAAKSQGALTQKKKSKLPSNLVWEDFQILEQKASDNQLAKRKREAVRAQIELQKQLEPLVTPLMNWIRKEHEHIVDKLKTDPQFETQTGKEQGRLYNEALGSHPLVSLMHLARREMLTEVDICNWLLDPTNRENLDNSDLRDRLLV